jgi:hypothetical protein
LAKSPCRGFATRNLAGVGFPDAGFFLSRISSSPGTPSAAGPFAGGFRATQASVMLGRHVYRVHPTEDDCWTVTKEGEDRPRGAFAGRDEAIAEAVRLAGYDEPAKVTVDNGDRTIADEWLFGSDPVAELEADP